MSKVKDNIITSGLSGKLGKQIVFRQWGGETFLSTAPGKSESLLKKEMYEKNRALFTKATAYAKMAMSDQDLKQAYKNKCNLRQNAYVRAVQDFLIAPSIGEIDLSNYTGKKDSFILIYATDDFRVNRVHVTVKDEQNQEVETGFAVQEEHTDWWKFVVNEAHVIPTGGKVVVSAYDLPGNETVKEVEM